MKEDKDNNATDITLFNLFTVFCKIGALSFGGHMSVVAFVEKSLVEDKKWLTAEQLLHAIGLLSVFPGPFFVNIVAYIGFLLRGWIGGLISLLAVILPASLLMLVFAVLYFRNAYLFDFKIGMDILLVAVAALILSTGTSLFKKQVKIGVWDLLFFATALLVAVWVKGQVFILLLMVSAGIQGYFAYRTGDHVQVNNYRPPMHTSWLILSAMAVILLLYVFAFYNVTTNVFVQLASLFSGMSLTLFGGGFVIIPYMKSLLVEQLQWISAQEFVYAITLGQITPGPLLVSVTFVGYKLGGIWGAVIATLSIFMPSASFAVAVVNQLKQTTTLNAILKGIQPVIVGLIMGSGLQLLMDLHTYAWYNFVIGGLAFVLLYRYKVSPAYVLSSAIALALIVRIIFNHE